MPIYQMDKVLGQLAQARRITSMAQRHGYVHETKESGGERKVRIVLGFGKDGQPWLSPWVHTEEHRGGSSSQQQVEKGQAMIYTCHGGDYRNATVSPGGESQSNPQPPHAPQFADSTSNGSKVRTATNKPSQSSGGSGGTSLLGSTEVLTVDGFKNIQDIKLGDKVLTCPVGGADRKPVEATVVGLHAALTDKQVYDLNYEGGRVCCTFDHEIWTDTRNQYVAVDRLAFVDKVRNYDGTSVTITSVVAHALSQLAVFDLTVAPNANFYVRDGNSGMAVLVHNADGGGGGGKDTHSIWIEKKKEQRQQHQEQTGQYEQAGSGGGSSQGQQGQQGQQSSNKPDPGVITHLNEDGTFTARNGTESRVMVAEKGSKLKTKKAWAVVTKDGKHIIKKPWIIGKDPIEDNDSV